MKKLLLVLALHDIDVVLTDSPIDPVFNVKAFNHLLGECGMVLFGWRPSWRRNTVGVFSALGLDGAPFLLPTRNTSRAPLVGPVVRH